VTKPITFSRISCTPCRSTGLAWQKFVFSRDSSYVLDDRDSKVRFPAGAGNFSLHHRVQNGSGAHPASYSMGSRGSFPGDKAAGA
jgi:hypothetical protein